MLEEFEPQCGLCLSGFCVDAGHGGAESPCWRWLVAPVSIGAPDSIVYEARNPNGSVTEHRNALTC